MAKEKLVTTDWPSVTYANIYNYLIQSMLKSYKSLDGYNSFCNGWVSGVRAVKIEQSAKCGSCVVVALVKHSQTLSAKALSLQVRWGSNKCTLYVHGWNWGGLLTHHSCSF